MKHIITDKTITLFINNKIEIFNRDDLISIQILDALNKKEFEKIPKLMDLSNRIKELGGGLFEIKNGNIYINGEQASKDVQDQIIDMAKIY